MFRTMTLAAAAVVVLAWGTEAAAISCEGGSAVQPLPVRTTPVPPLYSGMLGRPHALAAPRALLAESRDESLALDVVLTRLRLEACAAAPANEFADYVPKTEHDNTPYRFNMDKGKKFTAAEFDAWMKSRGVRVVQARPTGEAAGAAAATSAASAGATVSE
ncbi:hypothetical protein OS187_00565 [Xanthomonadaceae bacterium JHOS43]|nr:hypothetical protein [Xanthomonadaceae bacterium JHOS43]